MTVEWKKHAGKILHRCDLCGKFHAAYRVVDAQLGSLSVCYDCWKRRMEMQIYSQKQTDTNMDERQGST
jgi:ribosome-binding protein aMBF1 (putative translation factor)